MPIELEGEGHYALTAIKDIKVTEEFLGLGQKITRCQTREFRTDCVSRRYQEQVLASCHCTPLYIRHHLPQQVLLEQKYWKYSVGYIAMLDRDLLQQTAGLFDQSGGGHRGLSGAV